MIKAPWWVEIGCSNDIQEGVSNPAFDYIVKVYIWGLDLVPRYISTKRKARGGRSVGRNVFEWGFEFSSQGFDAYENIDVQNFGAFVTLVQMLESYEFLWVKATNEVRRDESAENFWDAYLASPVPVTLEEFSAEPNYDQGVVSLKMRLKKA